MGKSGLVRVHGRVAIWRLGAVLTASTTLLLLSLPPINGVAYADPSGTSVGPLTGTEGVALSNVVLAHFTETSGPESYTATIDWADGSTSSGTIDTSSSPFTVAGTHTYAEDGTYDVKVTIDGSVSGSSVVHDTAKIAEAPLALATLLPAPHYSGQLPEAGEGFPLTWDTQVVGATNENLSDFTAHIDWGDGSATDLTSSASPSGQIEIDPVNGLIVHGVHIFYEEGVYDATLTVFDEGTNVGHLGQKLAAGDDLINATAGPQVGIEGAKFSGQVATFKDTNPLTNIGDFTVPPLPPYDACNPPNTMPPPPPPTYGYVCIDWGDGSVLSDGSVAATGGGNYSVFSNHTFTEEGTYAVKVTVHDEGKAVSAGHTTYTIGDAQITSTGVPVIAAEATAATNVVVATVSDPNLFANASDFSATIKWGDGVTDTGVVTGPTAGVFDVTGSHTYADEGPFPISVTVTDDGGATTTSSTTATVADADGLVASPILGGVTAATGLIFSGPVATVTDSLTSTPASGLTASIDWGDGSTSTGTVTGAAGSFTVSGSHTYAEAGSPNITVTVTDPGGTSAVATASTTISQGDQVTFTHPAVAAKEGAAYSGTVEHFTDISSTATASQFHAAIAWGDGVTATATVAANPGGGFDVAGSHTYAEECSSCQISVTLIIGGSTFTATNAHLGIADAKLTATMASIDPTEGAPFSGPVATFTDADPNGAAGDYTATITWGDGHTSMGTVSATGGGFAVSGTNTYATNGPYSVTVAISDTGGATTSVSGPVGVGDAPLTAALGHPTPVEGEAFSGPLATFTDGDPGGMAANYSATIHWGDGSTSTGTITGPVMGVFTIAGLHTYAEEGGYPGSVSIADTGGATTSTSGTVQVADAPLTVSMSSLTPVEGPTPTLTVATFTDADPAGVAGDYIATINWGDNVTSTGAVSATSGGRFSVSGAHTYADEGDYSVTVGISDSGATATAGESVHVSDAGLAATLLMPSPTEGTAFSGPVATFLDADPGGAIGDYSASITWGDGTVSSGTVSANGGGWTVSGSHTYAKAGGFNPTVAITDSGGATTSATGPWTVADAALSGQMAAVGSTEGAAFSGVVASFTDADPGAAASDYAATINWGDGHNSVGKVAAAGNGFTVSSNNTYAEEGNWLVSVTVTDVGGYILSLSGTATVADASLHAGTLKLTAGSGSNSLGETAILAFTDSDPSGVATDYAVTVNWGDGQTSSGTASVGSGGFAATGSHTYSKKGSFTVTVTVNDAGASTSASGPVTKK
jgi:hypothetical protein